MENHLSLPPPIFLDDRCKFCVNQDLCWYNYQMAILYSTSGTTFEPVPNPNTCGMFQHIYGKDIMTNE